MALRRERPRSTSSSLPKALHTNYRPYPGDHSLNYFLSHLAEVMEFHSREFAAAK